jgi:hypothetical protein
LALIDDLETGLDLTGVGHDNQASILTDIKQTVLLESRGEHGMEDNGWGWVGNDTWLFAHLLGEQVNTEVTMLTGLGGGGDADDLAWAVLKDDEVTNADVVAWDGEVALCASWAWSWTRDGSADAGLWNRSSGNVLDFTVTSQGVSLAGLGVVGSRVENAVQLGTEVFQVVVVMLRVLAHFIFLYDNDFGNATTGFLVFDSDVDVLDVGWLGVFFGDDVDLWSRSETTNKEVL